MENGPDKLTKPLSSGPLIRRPPTDSKRPWLDWGAHEPLLPHHSKAEISNTGTQKPAKDIGTAYFWFWFSGGMGSHRRYLEYENCSTFTPKILGTFLLYICACLLIAGSGFRGANIILIALTIFFFIAQGYLGVREYRTIAPAFEAYEKKFYDQHPTHIPPCPHHRRQ